MSTRMVPGLSQGLKNNNNNNNPVTKQPQDTTNKQSPAMSDRIHPRLSISVSGYCFLFFKEKQQIRELLLPVPDGLLI